MERTGELLAFQAVKLAKSLTPLPVDTLQWMEDSLHFTGRFDKTLDYRVHLSTIIINNENVIHQFKFSKALLLAPPASTTSNAIASSTQS